MGPQSAGGFRAHHQVTLVIMQPGARGFRSSCAASDTVPHLVGITVQPSPTSPMRW